MSSKHENELRGGDNYKEEGPVPTTAVGRIMAKVDAQIMKMIEKDDSFEGLREKTKDKQWLYTTFFLGKVAFVTALIYFTVTGVASDQKARFIALDQSSGNCKEIPIALSGNYFLDDNGNWKGTDGYEAGKARYLIELNGFQHSVDEYASFIQDVRNIVYNVAANSSTYNLAVNLAYWAVWGYKYIDGKNVHYIRFAGDTRYIFNRFYKNGGFGSVSGDCDVDSTVLWELPTGILGLHMSYNATKSSKLCMGAMDPAALGYNPEINGDDFVFKFDSRSLMLGFAINFDITPVSLLNNVFDRRFDGLTIGCSASLNTPGCGDDKYTFFLGSDPDQPGMMPIYCLKPSKRDPTKSYNFNNLCAIRVADQYVYPYMQHFGLSGVNNNNPYKPRKCDCSSSDGDDDYCDDFDLNIGFVFFEAAAISGDKTPTTNFQYLLDMAYRYDKKDMNEMIYEAAFSIQRLGGAAADFPPDKPSNVLQIDYDKNKTQLSNPQWRSDAYKFCNGNCAVFSFRLFDAYNRFINAVNFDLESGGCEDTFYTKDDPFNIAATLPPVPLVQDYIECTNFLLASVTTSLGVAMGLSAPITAGFIMLVLLAVGKVYEFLTSKKEKTLAIARASMVLNEDDITEEIGLSSKASKGDLHSKSAIKLALARLPILGHLNNTELDALLGAKKNKKVTEEQFVYRENEPAEFFYYIKSGVFKIINAQGVEQQKVAGQVFGHVDLIPQRDRSESVQCISVGSEGKAALTGFPRSALVYISSKRNFAGSDSDSESETEISGYSDSTNGRGSNRGSSLVQFDDIFCGAGARSR